MLDLSLCRERIDQIDTQISALFVERMEVTAEVAEYKRATGKPIFDRAREQDNIVRAAHRVPDELAGYAATIESVLMEASREAQYRRLGIESEVAYSVKLALSEQPTVFPAEARVACQETEDFSQTDVCGHLFKNAQITTFISCEDAFRAIEADDCDFAVVPIETSIAGSLNQPLSLIMQYGFHIVRCCRLESASAKSAQDQSHHYTRFACVAKDLAIYPEANRTSLAATLSSDPESLHKLLGSLFVPEVNLVKLESRTVLGNNSGLMFFLDVECPTDAPRLQALLNSLSDASDDLRYLGSYSEVM